MRGKGVTGIEAALEDMRRGLPFALKGLDSDNGSEFLNHHLWRYTQAHTIQFTRGRPYKKDDNAHIEQKNWTHVRKLLAWERYDTLEAVAAINRLYAHDLRLFMNLFQPSMKLAKKVRVGSRLTRVYEAAQMPLDRVAACPDADHRQVAALRQLRARLDPFLLSQRIDERLARIFRLATRTGRLHGSTSAQVIHPSPRPPIQRAYYWVTSFNGLTGTGRACFFGFHATGCG